VILLLAAYALVAASVRFSGIVPPRHIDVLSSFWEEPETPVISEA
jgi:hypothetical protein